MRCIFKIILRYQISGDYFQFIDMSFIKKKRHYILLSRPGVV